MFFSITGTKDSRFPDHYQFDKLWFNCDSGWQLLPHGFYKGYADNYCKISVDKQGIAVEHSTPRSFPLWFQHGSITNLLPYNWQQAWTDDALAIKYTGEIVASKLDLDLAVPATVLSTDQAVDQIVRHLNRSTEDLFTYKNKNLKLFCTGGLDTFLLYGMLTAYGIEFELIKDEHYQLDEFTQQNQAALNSYWSYKQMHYWTEPTWLATGSCGDEYFLRGPAVIAMLTAWHNINFGQLLSENPNAYHYQHFKKYQDLWTDSWLNRQALQSKYTTREQLNQHIIDHLLNDHQHWHLGKVTTWTPFKNIDLVKILLQCDIQDLLPQFLDGQLSKRIIKHYSPGVLDFTSTYKNYNNKEKLPDFFTWHEQR
jgi:hypothetical protein